MYGLLRKSCLGNNEESVFHHLEQHTELMEALAQGPRGLELVEDALVVEERMRKDAVYSARRHLELVDLGLVDVHAIHVGRWGGGTNGRCCEECWSKRAGAKLHSNRLGNCFSLLRSADAPSSVCMV